jgi:two-component system sensor histidine kinase KdpD
MSRHAQRLAELGLALAAGLTASTLAVAALEETFGIPNASTVYVVAVAAIAILFGVVGAIVAAVLAILVYDFLFTDPVYTLTVADPDEWLSLVLLLFVAVTVGQLAALQRRRAEVAFARERESRALFSVTRALATRDSFAAALPAVVEVLRNETELDAVWIAIGPDDPGEQVIAQAGDGALPRRARPYHVLHRGAEGSARWTLVRPPATPAGHKVRAASARLLRVRITDAGLPVGSIWGEQHGGADPPDAEGSALLLVATDLLGQALARERLSDEMRRAEIAQQSDAVKTALLESVSHNLRTPLASIRASAGTLMDPDVALSEPEFRASAASIDREAQRLNRLVGNLLDLGRIEGGALRAAREALELDDVVARAVTQTTPRLRDRVVEVRIPTGTAVIGDPVLLEETLLNLLDNAAQHTPGGSVLRITAVTQHASVALTVEDSGAGVPDDQLERIFDKFFRGLGSARRSGSGIGLAVVRGFVEAMAGRVVARRSELGGLAVDIELPAAPATTDGGPG